MKRKKEPEEFPEKIEYREALKDMKDAEIRIALRGHGLDPYELSQKDMDEIRRLINKMQQVDATTKSRMNAIQQEGQIEQNLISQEIEAIIKRVYAEQHPGSQAVATGQPPPEAQPNMEVPVQEGQAAETNVAPVQEEAVVEKEQEPGQVIEEKGG